MTFVSIRLAVAGALLLSAMPMAEVSPAAQMAAVQRLDLAEQLAAKKIRTVSREATPLQGTPGAIHLSGAPGNGIAWLEATDFANGTIEVDVRGRDAFQQSFLGVAFHRRDDNTYEVVYLRPFNFRAEDPMRYQHAVQYAMVPDYDWPRLRKEFPEEFENPVDKSISPTDWVPLRIVVNGPAVQIYAGAVKLPALEVRKLGALDRGMIGLWVGNSSDGDFKNLRVTPTK
jgi:hypothetical protein